MKLNMTQIKAKGFDGNETEKDLLFYLIGKIDSFDSKNSEEHETIKQTQHELHRKLGKETLNSSYTKLGVYGAWVVILFILGVMYL